MEYTVKAALVGAILGLFISRKFGPFHLFSLVKSMKVLYPVTRCETCLTAWASMLAKVLFGIIPSMTFSLSLLNPLELLAAASLGLIFAAFAAPMVMEDHE